MMTPLNHNDIKIGDQVVYIPSHVLSEPLDDIILAAEPGVVTSKNDHYIFVKYKTSYSSQATNATDLFNPELLLNTMTDNRKFGPKKSDHPSIGKECPAYHQLFKGGDYTTLVSLGPGDDPEAQEKARTGKAYNAVAIEIHWTCSTGEI